MNQNLSMIEHALSNLLTLITKNLTNHETDIALKLMHALKEQLHVQAKEISIDSLRATCLQKIHKDWMELQENYASEILHNYNAHILQNSDANFTNKEDDIYSLDKEAKALALKTLENNYLDSYLQYVQLQIQSTAWRTAFNGGKILPGLNNEQRIPNNIVEIYHIIKNAHRDGLKTTFDQLAPLAKSCAQKTHSFNFFYKRKPETITYYQQFAQEYQFIKIQLAKFNELAEKLAPCKSKIHKP